MEKVTFLIPCRKGSQRIPNKNLKEFDGSTLFEIKIKQLLSLKIDCEIVVSTDDEEIKAEAKRLSDKIIIHDRDSFHATSECDTNSLIEYFSKELDFEHLLWTHVTSPFIKEEKYESACEQYFTALDNGFDSLVTVDKCRDFVWDENLKSVNYDSLKIGRWPQTQRLNTLNIINSGIFLISKEMMLKTNDRVGVKPFLLESDKIESLDIDWPEDFELAEKLWRALKK